MGMRWRPDNDPEQISLWLLPSGPDQVGEHSAHRRSPRPISRFEPASARLGLSRDFFLRPAGGDRAPVLWSQWRSLEPEPGRKTASKISKGDEGREGLTIETGDGPEGSTRCCIHDVLISFKAARPRMAGLPAGVRPVRNFGFQTGFLQGLVGFRSGFCRVLQGFSPGEAGAVQGVSGGSFEAAAPL